MSQAREMFNFPPRTKVVKPPSSTPAWALKNPLFKQFVYLDETIDEVLTVMMASWTPSPEYVVLTREQIQEMQRGRRW